jgi:hypothetical protein
VLRTREKAPILYWPYRAGNLLTTYTWWQVQLLAKRCTHDGELTTSKKEPLGALVTIQKQNAFDVIFMNVRRDILAGGS